MIISEIRLVPVEDIARLYYSKIYKYIYIYIYVNKVNGHRLISQTVMSQAERKQKREREKERKRERITKK